VVFGLYLGNQFASGQEPAAGLADQLALVREARDNGWDAVWVGHHYLTDSFQMFHPVPFLTHVASQTEHMRLGTSILLLSMENPVAAAEQFATLDVLSGGRLMLGAGLGYRDIEFDAFGVPRRERARRFETNVDIVNRLWRGEAVTVDEPWCRLEDATISVRPLQAPRPPLWIGGTSDAGVLRAARLADGWMINLASTHDDLVRQAAAYRGAAESGGRIMVQKYASYASWGQANALPSTATLEVGFEELAAGRFILGDPDECVRQLLTWIREVDADDFGLRCHWPGMPIQPALDSIRLLSREVLPAVREAMGNRT
jgi:alkanesulfonate monooxygenase SsuD/methylene tetrahydromethanopterin reductase-like flavin-dependent oxidoreductase (luciferase family)